jgi:hypothetical protein
VAIAVLVLVVWVGLAGLLALSARGHLLAGAELMRAGQAQVIDGDLDAAVADIGEARERFRAATWRLRNPIVIPLTWVPVAGRQLGVPGRIAAAGVDVAEAALVLAEGVEALPGGVASLSPSDGALPVEPLRALAGPAARADELLAGAEATFARARLRWLVPQVAEGAEDFAEQLAAARTAVGAAAGLTAQLPGFFGADEPRTYLFAAANTAELRGTGGFLGALTLLEIDEGRLQFGAFEPTDEVPRLPPDALDEPTPGFAELYERFGALGNLRNVNATADFPTAARAIEAHYAQARDVALDGVIVADPVALAALLEVGGPVDVPGFGTVDHTQVVRFVTQDAYAIITDPEERKAVLGQVAAGALQGLLADGGEADAPDLARALAEAVSGGHLLVHAADPQVQEAFMRAGVAGALEPDETDLFGVFVNNAAYHKADTWLQRGVNYTVQLRADGSGVAVADVELRNEAPTEGFDEYVIGPNREGLAAGDALLSLSAYCAPGCTQQVERLGGPVEEVIGGSERDMTVSLVGVHLRSGESQRLRYSLDLPAAWDVVAEHGQRGTYRLTFADQITLNDTALEVEVTVPDGFAIVSASEEVQVEGATVRWSGIPERRQVIAVEFARPWAERARATVVRFLNDELVRIGG